MFLMIVMWNFNRCHSQCLFGLVGDGLVCMASPERVEEAHATVVRDISVVMTENPAVPGDNSRDRRRSRPKRPARDCSHRGTVRECLAQESDCVLEQKPTHKDLR